MGVLFRKVLFRIPRDFRLKLSRRKKRISGQKENDNFENETPAYNSKLTQSIGENSAFFWSCTSLVSDFRVECECSSGEHKSLLPKIPIYPLSDYHSVSKIDIMMVASSLLGKWVTILEKSDSLDNQYKAMGVNFVKRKIMNRLAIQLTISIEDESNMQTIIHTPAGPRYMNCNLDGAEYEDRDPDCGNWTGWSQLVNFEVPWFCSSKPVRALQQRRYNERVGHSISSRCVLPDKKEGVVMLFYLWMRTNSGEEYEAKRILKRLW